MTQTFVYERVSRIIGAEYTENEGAMLTRYGSLGWELAAVIERRRTATLTYIFKRAVTLH